MYPVLYSLHIHRSKHVLMTPDLAPVPELQSPTITQLNGIDIELNK